MAVPSTSSRCNTIFRTVIMFMTHTAQFENDCNHGIPFVRDRCEVRCPNGTYGENCENNCSHCFNGICHVVTGECLCDPGFYGI